MKIIEKDVNMPFDIDHMTNLANDRAAWRDLIRTCAMSNQTESVIDDDDDSSK